MGTAQTSILAGTVIALSIALLAGTTVLWQEQHLGLRYVEGEQFARHQSVLSGSAPNPWRYRVLAEWIAAGFIKAAYVTQVPRPIAVGFLGLRFFQNALIFLLAFMYYRRLDLGRRQALVGVVVLAFAFTYAVDNSDLSFNTYFEVAFYLLAVLFLGADRVLLFLLVIVFASLKWSISPAIVAVYVAYHMDRQIDPLLPDLGSYEHWRLPQRLISCVFFGILVTIFSALPAISIQTSSSTWPVNKLRLVVVGTTFVVGLTMALVGEFFLVKPNPASKR